MVLADSASGNRAIGGALAAACRELRPAQVAALYETQREVSIGFRLNLIPYVSLACRELRSAHGNEALSDALHEDRSTLFSATILATFSRCWLSRTLRSSPVTMEVVQRL